MVVCESFSYSGMLYGCLYTSGTLAFI